MGISPASTSKNALGLAKSKHRINAAGRSGKPVRLFDYDVLINPGPTPADLYEDIFINRVYEFEASRPDPRIIDCGSNIGMSVLYFKHVYPEARIVGFEPDPTIMTFRP